jgi:hypothetical protein
MRERHTGRRIEATRRSLDARGSLAHGGSMANQANGMTAEGVVVTVKVVSRDSGRSPQRKPPYPAPVRR